MQSLKVQRANGKPSDAAHRMNFLYQASALFATSPETRNLSRFYSSTMRKVSARSVLRMYVSISIGT